MDDSRKTRAQLLEELKALRGMIVEVDEDEARRHRLVLENARALILETRDPAEVTYVSPSSKEILGYAPEEMLHQDLRDWLHPEDGERNAERWDEVAQAGKSARVLARLRHADGGWRWHEMSWGVYYNATGEPRSVMVCHDVSERIRAEEELRRSEERFRLLAQTAGYSVSEIDAEGRIVYVSPNIVDTLGFQPKDLIGTNFVWKMHPDFAEERVAEFLSSVEAGGAVLSEPALVQAGDGSWRWVESVAVTSERSGGEKFRLAMYRDVTERVEQEQRRRELEERMQQAQKLEGLGVMAGGIAHDFNNLLTPILGESSLALLDLPPESPVRVRLQKVQQAAHRAAALTNQMLAYAGEDALHVELLNLSRLVNEIAQLLETAASREAVLAFDLARQLPPVEGDSARISQVVMNLITNASEALRGREGRITLRTGGVALDTGTLGRAILGAELPAGDYVFLEVEDTGCGMDDETQGRIFDPFFTTKFTGRGLGLAAVLGIVRSHRGAIELQSEPEQGTRFRVYFPSADRHFSRPALPAPARRPWRGRGTVLVVDDEADVLSLASDTLKRAGLRVLTASDGLEAVACFEEHGGDIDLVLLDRTMPNLSGEETFAQLRQLDPGLRVVLVSGYSEQRAAHAFEGRGLAGFLHKPFLPEQLLDKVRKAIGEDST